MITEVCTRNDNKNDNMHNLNFFNLRPVLNCTCLIHHISSLEEAIIFVVISGCYQFISICVPDMRGRGQLACLVIRRENEKKSCNFFVYVCNVSCAHNAKHV
jgi:hypothetical protein